MLEGSRKFRTLYSVCCITLLLSGVLGVVAQSGRRARQPSPAPAPVPETTPTPAPAAEKPKPTFTFVVGVNQFGDATRVSLDVYSGVLDSCSDRLNDAPAVQTIRANSSMTRSDAIKKAKAEQEAFVVLLELRPNSFSGRGEYENPNNVIVEYSVFAPHTARIATSGSTYPDASRRRIKLPTSTTIGDYYLNQAARQAAERILDHFHQRVPRRFP